MAGNHLEMVGVGKGCLASQTKSTCLVSIVLLGGIPIGTVDQAHVVMVDAFTKVLDDEFVLGQGDLNWTIRTTRLDVGIPGIAKHFTYYGQDLILVEGARQDVEEFSTVGDTKLDGLFATDDSVSDMVIVMGYLHGDLSEKEKATLMVAS